MQALLFLDLKTMVFLAIVLTLLFSALLALARMHSGAISGLGYWALGSLALSMGMLVMFLQFNDAVPTRLIPATVLIALGNGLYICGIQAFRERIPNHWIPAGFAILTAIVDSYFLAVQHDV